MHSSHLAYSASLSIVMPCVVWARAHHAFWELVNAHIWEHTFDSICLYVFVWTWSRDTVSEFACVELRSYEIVMFCVHGWSQLSSAWFCQRLATADMSELIVDFCLCSFYSSFLCQMRICIERLPLHPFSIVDSFVHFDAHWAQGGFVFLDARFEW